MQQRTIKVAGLRIGIRTRRTLTIELCADYLCDEPPDFVVSATEAEIAREEKNGFCYAYAEQVCLHRAIAARVPDYDALVVHAAVIEHDGRAYAFAAPSGTGKTTHVQQYLARFGDKIRVICGDKPIFRLENGAFFAYGTPWNGQEKLGTGGRAPLDAICFLARGTENRIRPLTPQEALPRMLHQLYFPADPDRRMKTLALADALLRGTRLYALQCRPDAAAAELSCRALCGSLPE